MKEDITRDICWRLFEGTGEINYYMLYKALEEGVGESHE